MENKSENNSFCSPEESFWQARTDLLLGREKAEALRSSHVLVIGLGGVGGLAAEMICRAGISKMTIADGDIVETTNRNRQCAALTSTVGKKKVTVMQERLMDINPDLDLAVCGDFLEDLRMEELLLAAKYDCVLDAIDTIAPKLLLAKTCLIHKIPLVSCMGSGARMDPAKITVADIGKTYNCPLAASIRKQLRKENFHKGFKAVFSTENAIRSAVVECFSKNKRSNTGTISYMPAAFACHCAAAVVEEILKNHEKGKK
ncbi:MAG: tRNA threonylcarbamoyladenosine dehydratase [Lentisphaeria bacterium]|nr:tRNA threonylcarbamoyladenosine dehydratase [Lentisphaeria bacterium]